MKYVLRKGPPGSTLAKHLMPHNLDLDWEEGAKISDKKPGSIRLKPEVEEWSKKTFGCKPYELMHERAWAWGSGPLRLYFKNKDDALLFRMTWE